ncbi:hypothetical protein HGRIS_013450 [Hohenbuehelia grisea]|uniref:alpha-1,2-Mannosidase n=1 Tax=Hohenbuehelia grisea TaxID=104357 RepID=A0ABR3IVI6_9AGAR
MVDSLDTMWLMGFHSEFNASMQVVAGITFDLPDDEYAPFFETVIRYLGGLLSAYAISGETLLLSRADDLGRKLLPVFNSTSGLPKFGVNTVTGLTSLGSQGGSDPSLAAKAGSVLFAEIATCQMEYKYLAHLTGRKEYFQKVEDVMDKMYTANVEDGLFAETWDPKTAAPLDHHLTAGGASDSGYEYFLKQYLLSNKSEPKARDQYIKSANGIINNLLYLSPKRGLLYVTDTNNTQPSHILEHLSCFLPGLFALGVHTIGDELAPRERQLHQWAATGLAHTCWTVYAESATGLGAEKVRFVNTSKPWIGHVEAWERAGSSGGLPPGLREVPPAGEGDRDYILEKEYYILRPETIESFFIMWKTTGDTKWRERGWAAFEAIEKHARTKHGYANIKNVDKVPVELEDHMPSFFLAETLKYLYLLFLEYDVIPLAKWVFNTEAHPLPKFDWSDWEKKDYRIV